MATAEKPHVTPSQIRAGRALLDWSQEQLAEKAKVGLSSVRDYEKERRGGEAGGAKAIRLALEDQGVVFLPSEGDLGPGVRLTAKTPNVLRRPTKLGRCDALMISVEWRGREIEVFVSQEALDDLGEFRETRPEAEYVALFDQKRARILKAAAAAIDAGRVTPDRRVHLTSDDFPARAR
ncbi:MAG: helix-turn-helix domain-containing protein [Methylocella sp.]